MKGDSLDLNAYGANWGPRTEEIEVVLEISDADCDGPKYSLHNLILIVDQAHELLGRWASRAEWFNSFHGETYSEYRMGGKTDEGYWTRIIVFKNKDNENENS